MRILLAVIVALQLLAPAAPVHLRVMQGILTTSSTIVTITAPTSAATYNAGTSATLTTLAGTAQANQAISACTWTNSLGGSGSATGTATWTVASIALTVGTNVITVTCPNAAGTGTDVLTVTRSAGSAYYTGTLRTPACSDAAIDSAITASVSGDIVRMTSACASFTASITIPSTKGILFDGNGSTFNSASTVDVTPNATTSTRVTNFTFAGSGSCSVDMGGLSLTTAPWRVDHVTLTANGGPTPIIMCLNVSPGLIDHVTHASLSGAQEFIHVNGYGVSDTVPPAGSGPGLGWSTALTPGSAQAVYLEDNTFTGIAANNAWVQSYYGARTVLRYNTMNKVNYDNHGGDNEGGRWWEIYKNIDSNQTEFWPNIRAGSGVVWGNQNIGGGYCEESTGYPATDQVGRGQAQALYPAYAWLTGSGDHAVNECGGVGVGANMVLFNRDLYTDVNAASCTAGSTCTAGVGAGTTLPTSCTTNTAFWKTDAGGDWDTTHGGANDGALYKCTSTNTWTLYYTPYTYPHPLQASLEPDK